ncbi:TPA: DUF3164 family protein [Morganella morganii]|nr:DUF3164 family protein [Morganella morganii]
MSDKDTQFTQHTVPDGYWRDARGCLIPVDMLKDIDRARDTVVGDIVSLAEAQQAALKTFKRYAFDEVDAFRELSSEQYGVGLGGKKGNIQLHSFDGEYRVQVAIQDHTAFDERLQAAKALIDECIRDWSTGARPEIMAIIEDAFKVDTVGNIRTKDILKLRRLNITDEKWLRAMTAISESIQTISSSRYIRIYKRSGTDGKYVQISLDIAGV